MVFVLSFNKFADVQPDGTYVSNIKSNTKRFGAMAGNFFALPLMPWLSRD